MNILERLGHQGMDMLVNLPGTLVDRFSNMGIAVSLIAALVLLFFAFCSYKLFKITLVLVGVGFGFMASEIVVAPLLSNIIEFEYLTLACGILLAIPFAILAVRMSRAFIYFAAASSLYSIAYPMLWATLSVSESMAATSASIVSTVIALVLAALAGTLALKLFKPVFIICTALVCSITAAIAIAVSFLPTGNTVILGATAVGAVVALLAMTVQFKTTKHD